MTAFFDRRFLNYVVMVWTGLTLLSMALWHAPHGGVLVYDVFAAVGWPFFFYLEHWNTSSFFVSLSVEGVYSFALVTLFSSIGRLRQRK